MIFLKNKNILVVAICLVCWNSFSQELIVKDSQDNSEINNATVYNTQRTISVLSNSEGVLDLSKFNKTDTLVFSHLSYEKLILAKSNFSVEKSILFMDSNTQKLNEIILSVARNKEDKGKISKQVSLITQKDLELNMPQTSADLLLYASGVRVQKSQGGGGSPVIRGFEANRVLLVIDGVRMNNAIYRSGHLQNSITINPNSLERTEIIYGPSSVGYGSDALGGVVHYYTKTPKINNEKKWNIKVISSFNPRLHNTIQNLDFEHSEKRWASYTNISFSKFGDIVMGSKRNHGFKDWGLDNHYLDSNIYNVLEIKNSNPKTQLNTAYHQYDFMQKFNIMLSESSNMILNFQHSKSSDINRFDKLNETKNGAYKYSVWRYGPQKRTMISSALNFSKKKKLSDKVKLLIAYQNIGESRHFRKFQELSKTNQIEDLNIFSINSDFIKLNSNRSSLAYGFEYVYNNVNSKAYIKNYTLGTSNELIEDGVDYDIPTRYPSDEGHYATTAAYYEYRKDLSQKSNMNIGMRYTNTHLRAKWNDQAIINANIYDINSQNSSLTSSIGYVLRSDKNWLFNANFSSGFRSPNIDDIGKIREQKGVLSVPNAELKPEYAYNTELGFSKSFNRQNVISINAYYTHISKHITRDYFEIINDTSTEDKSTIIFNSEEVITMANVNKGSAYIYGGTLDLKAHIYSNLLFTGNLTYTDGASVKNAHPLPSISPFFGYFSLKFLFKKSETQLAYRFSNSKNSDKYSIGGEDGLEETPEIFQGLDSYFYGMPSWSILKLSSSYEFSNNFKTILILDNIFDLHYREFASGISAPGRNLNVVLSYKF
jgi:hemoglobin/transferrin/lactoferrin receptor protein